MSPIADRSIIVKIGANVQGLVNGLKTADKAAQDWGNRTLSYVEKNSAQINTLANGLGLVGAALTGVAVLAVKTFADFDAAMSSVQASTMETAANMDLLRDAAIDAGSRTVYSATEAAGAIEELAKAGVSTADILGGGLDGALDLAASGAIGVGEAAEIAATAMTQFGLGGEDVTHIADLLAAGAGKAQGGVGDLGAALKQAGLVANQTGLTIEETTAGLTAFASAGLTGSDAGTSFKAMLQRLTPQSKEAETLMKQLGVSAYDAGGNFVGLSEFAGNLQSSLKSLTPEQRNSALATIFGSDAVRAANVLYEQGAAGIDQWTAAVNDQGYAAEQAAIRMDNLKGDIEGLSGSLETALIGLGEGANGPLRSLVQGLDGAVDSFNGMSDGAKQATLALVGGSGLVLLGIAGLGKMTVAISNTLTSLQSMGAISEATSGRIAAGLGKAAKAVGVLGAAYGAAAIAAQALGKESEPLSEAQWADALANGADLAAKSLEGVGGEFYNLQTAYDRLTSPSNVQKLDDWSGNLIGMNSSADLLTDQFTSMGQALANLYASDPAGAAAQFSTVLDMTGGSTETLLDLMPAYRDILLEGKNATTESTSALATYAAGLDSGTVTVEDYTTALEELIAAQAEAAGVVLDLWTAQNNSVVAYEEATAAIQANGAAFDQNSEQGRANRDAVREVVEADLALIESMRQNGATQSELQGQMQVTRDRFVALTTAATGSADEANRLADELGLIPANVNVNVQANTQDAINNLDRLRATLDKIPGFKQIGVNTVLKPDDGFASGGYTGNGGKYEPAGIVHRGEFVIDKEKTAANRPLLEAIQSGRSYADGGYVSRQYVAPPVYQQSGASGGMGGGSVSFLEGATLIAADPRAAVKEFRSEVRLSLAGSGM